MKRILALAVVGFTLCTALPALAGPVQQRLHRQHQRIAEGQRSGELTRREARGWWRGERRIAMERGLFARSDGRIGPWEHARLRRDLDRQDRRIYRLKHNGCERSYARAIR